MARKRIEISPADVDAYFARCTATASAPRVSEFAHQLGISRVTLTQRFQETSGMPLSEYFAAKREEWAAELLIESNLKTEAIAIQAGFGTTRTFQRVFARKYGITPARYRKLIRTSLN